MADLAAPDVQVADPSPALEIPRGGEDYANWRQTGKLPEKPKADPAPAKEHSEKPAPASEAGTTTQEKPAKRDNAATRLDELLADLKRAGLSPAELKTYRREAQKEQQAEPLKEAAPEPPAKPAELKAPERPKADKFKTWEEYEAAKETYYEELAEFKAAQKIADYRQEQAQNAAQQTVRQKMEEARSRYGDEAVSAISSAARAITGDQQIPPAVKSILDQSPVWTDVLYTLGGKPEELAGFVHLARTDPGAAIRKAVLLEHLVQQELAKGGKPAQHEPEAEAEAEAEEPAAPRDKTGKFAKPTPERKESDAPPPPREVSGRGTTPADEVSAAVKTGDFRSFRSAQNARDLARRQGR